MNGPLLLVPNRSVFPLIRVSGLLSNLERQNVLLVEKTPSGGQCLGDLIRDQRNRVPGCFLFRLNVVFFWLNSCDLHTAVS